MEVINVKPGDILVYSTDKIPSEEYKKEIKNIISEKLSFDIEILFKVHGVELSVIRPDNPKTIENPDKVKTPTSTLMFWNENKVPEMHSMDTYFNVGTPVLVGMDGLPIYYAGDDGFRSIRKARLIDGKLFVEESEPEKKGLGGKVKRKEVDLCQTSASIEMIESSL